MILGFTTEHRFLRTPDGKVWTTTNSGYSLWRRYLEVFDAVNVYARIVNTDTPPERCIVASGPGVSFQPLPNYNGWTGFLRALPAISRAAMRGTEDVYILRIPSPVSIPFYLRQRRRAYAVEVAGDPSRTFSPGVYPHPLRPLFRRYLTAAVRRQCRNARVALYVTQSYLQERYPTAGMAFAVSDVELDNDWFGSSPFDQPYDAARLIFVGAMETPGKGVDVLLEALALMKNTRATLTLVGDGRLRPHYEQQAQRLGLSRRVRFTGALPLGPAVRHELDQASIFVLPSLNEGLPRALLEAMARGLPCVATLVGGIPEVLEPSFLVAPGNPHSLAAKLDALLSSIDILRQAGRKNAEIARQFAADVLDSKRRQFLEAVRRAAKEASPR